MATILLMGLQLIPQTNITLGVSHPIHKIMPPELYTDRSGNRVSHIPKFGFPCSSCLSQECQIHAQPRASSLQVNTMLWWSLKLKSITSDKIGASHHSGNNSVFGSQVLKATWKLSTDRDIPNVLV
jgi:hypothetical protein